MKRILLILSVLLLAGCNGGGSDNSTQLQSAPDALLAKSGLQLSWTDTGTAYELTLIAGQAADLYQAAATISFPAERYAIGDVSPAGGLGSPAETYFAGGVTEPGRLEFGYTKRFAGPGEFGDVALVRFRVDKTTDFDISDFAVDYEQSPPLIRDSSKQIIDMPRAGGAR